MVCDFMCIRDVKCEFKQNEIDSKKKKMFISNLRFNVIIYSIFLDSNFYSSDWEQSQFIWIYSEKQGVHVFTD